ncbi:MAG TPA: hypothetical protein VFL85_04885 [Candidatus Saccharimonadales bacterium]|nr:hypothetical protein [Candidatus Saccharimonadales bacterium]
MSSLRRNTKRILTDAAGYGLLILAALTGWLPGPGGIPLALAGLGLLSINNAWARKIRDYLLDHGGKIVRIIFPPNPVMQWLYDIVVVLLFALVVVLEWRHAAVWQMSLGIALFFIAVAIALLNRDRYNRLKNRRKKA